MAWRATRLRARFRSASQSPGVGLALDDGGLGPRDLGVVGPGVDLEEDGPLLDLVPVAEVHLLQIAVDPGPDLDHLHGGGLPDQPLLVVGDLADDRLLDHDDRRLRGGLFAGA